MSGEASERDIAELSFEEALAELERIVRELEEGKGGLEAAIRAYETGDRLKRHCEAKLREAKAKVEKIAVAQGGAATTEPLDVE